jgi:hypothetical protein
VGLMLLLPSKFGSQSEEVVDRCNQLFLSNDNINWLVPTRHSKAMVVLNCFLVTSWTLIDDLNMEGFNVVMETNLQGMDLNLKCVVRGLTFTKQGMIICPRNILGMMGRMTNTSYSSSKVVITIVHSNVYLQVMNSLFWSPLCIIG